MSRCPLSAGLPAAYLNFIFTCSLIAASPGRDVKSERSDMDKPQSHVMSFKPLEYFHPCSPVNQCKDFSFFLFFWFMNEYLPALQVSGHQTTQNPLDRFRNLCQQRKHETWINSRKHDVNSSTLSYKDKNALTTFLVEIELKAESDIVTFI